MKTYKKARPLQFLRGAILLALLLNGKLLFAQQSGYTISGKVVEESSNQPVIGATVQIEGTNLGTITDADGNFKVTAKLVPGEYTLVVRSLGYLTSQQAITLGTNPEVTLEVQLKSDLLNLEEIVVTGNSVATSKKQLGNAISTVDAKELNAGGARGVDQALSGKISGALIAQNSGNPAGGISVILRGNSTVLGSSDPLYIVDGVFVDNSSPELVDLGGYAQNRLVDINPDDIEKIEVIKGAAAAAIYGSRASNGVVQIFTKKGVIGKPRISFSTSFQMNQLRKEIEENLEPFRYINPNDPSQGLEPTERYKMQDYIFRTGFGTNNNISVRGGTTSTKYYFSGSAFYNQGIIKNSDFSRYTVRSNIDQFFNNWLTGSLGLTYTHNYSNEIPNGGLGEFYGVLTGYNFNNTDYNPEPDAAGNYISPAGFVVNPLEGINKYDFNQTTDRFTGSLGLVITPVDNLTIDYRFGMDTYTQGAKGYIPIGTNGLYSSGWYRTAVGNAFLTNQRLVANYELNITNNIKLTTTLGGEIQYDIYKRLAMTANNLSPLIQTTDGGSITSRVDFVAERSFRGAFIQETLALFDRLFLTGAVRVDAASAFGLSERTQIYPKASMSYLLSEENFWQNSLGGVLNTFKIRASYGQAGNLTALGAYDRFSNYNPNPMLGQTGLIPSTRLGNNALKPERQAETEIGVDLGLINGKVGIEFTYYNVKVTDLLLNRILAPSTGYSTQFQNVGEMTNKGIEMLLKANIISNDKFRWDLTATYSTNKNQVNGIEGERLALPKSFGVSVAQNGQPIGAFYGFYYAREADGSISLDANGLPYRAQDENGVTDRKIIGDPNPDWLGSLINEFSYGKFSLRVQFDAVQGFDVFNFTDRVNSRSRFGGGWRDAQEIRGELPPGYNNAAYNIWERYIEDGSFVKLRELSLNYHFNPKTDAIDNINIFLIGRNILSFDNYTGWDPEVNAAGQQNGVRGFDFNEVPIPRTWRLGVKFDF